MLELDMAAERFPVTAQFLSFSVIGAIATAVQYMILVSLVRAAQISPVNASAFAFGLSAVINYALNYRITFRSDKRHLEAFVKFAVIAMVGLLLNTTIMLLAAARLHAHYFIAQVFATGVVLAWNFVGHRAWTFQFAKA